MRTRLGFKRKTKLDVGADGSHPIMANAKTSQMDEPHPDYNKEFINSMQLEEDKNLNKVSAFGNIMSSIMQKAVAHPRIAGAVAGGAVGGAAGALTSNPDHREAGMLTGMAAGAGVGALAGKKLVSGIQSFTKTPTAPISTATPKLLSQNATVSKQQMVNSAAIERGVTTRNAATHDAHLTSLRMNAKPFPNTLPDDSSFKVIKKAAGFISKAMSNQRFSGALVGGTAGSIAGGALDKDTQRGTLLGAATGATAGYFGGPKLIEKLKDSKSLVNEYAYGKNPKQLISNTRDAVGHGYDLNKFERNLSSLSSKEINKTINNIPNPNTRKAAFKIYQQHLAK